MRAGQHSPGSLRDSPAHSPHSMCLAQVARAGRTQPGCCWRVCSSSTRQTWSSSSVLTSASQPGLLTMSQASAVFPWCLRGPLGGRPPLLSLHGWVFCCQSDRRC